MSSHDPEASWERRESVDVPGEVARRLTGSAAPLLLGGLVNANLRVGDRVLRIWTRGPQVAAREVGVLRLVRGVVPVPAVLETGELDGWPYAWLEALPGRRVAVDLPTATVARDLGHHLAALHAVAPPSELGPALELPSAWEDYVAECLAGPAGTRLGDLRPSVEAWAERQVGELGAEDPSVLLHGDYKPTNVLAERDRVTGVLDWEFAWVGPPLFDLGQMIRWEDRYGPGFGDALVDGYGVRPADWRRRARRLDFLNLLGFLADDRDRPRVHADTLERVARTLAAG